MDPQIDSGRVGTHGVLQDKLNLAGGVLIDILEGEDSVTAFHLHLDVLAFTKLLSIQRPGGPRRGVRDEGCLDLDSVSTFPVCWLVPASGQVDLGLSFKGK